MPEQGVEGPYLGAALLCERAIQDVNGIFSLISVVDQYVLTLPEDVPNPSPESAFPLPITLFVSLKWIGVDGTKLLAIHTTTPSGHREEHPASTVRFAGAGAAVVIDLMVLIGEVGRHWFDIYLEGTLMTRVPLEIVVVRMPRDATETPNPPAQ